MYLRALRAYRCFASATLAPLSGRAHARLVSRSFQTLKNDGGRYIQARVSEEGSECEVTCLFDEETCTAQYVVACAETKQCAIIDPVLDFDPTKVQVFGENVKRLLNIVKENEYTPRYVFDTHVHADHITGSYFLGKELGSGVERHIGRKVLDLQYVFKEKLRMEKYSSDGRYFGTLLEDGAHLSLGNLKLQALSTPGHTPACMSYYVDGHGIFVGDTLLMPDSGTARCDFPQGSARTLYQSIQRLLAFPDHVRIYVCHDYRANGARDEYSCWSTVQEQRETNIHLQGGEEDFVAIREARDATLSPPRLLWPSITFNLRGGRQPPADEKGGSFIKLPIATNPEVGVGADD